ncbi:putative tail-fiber protein [Vibrio phage VP16T]|nr:putative tail-fiber protein [Vibrio phage VP16T]
MALNYRDITAYDGVIDETDLANYPYGKPQNIVTEGDGRGTIWDQLNINDWWGFLQSILHRASVMPNNMPDSIGNPQYLDALTAIAAPRVGERLRTYGTAAEPQYLRTDGSAVSRTTYADLFAVIGTTYGAGDGSTTFNLPQEGGQVPTPTPGETFVEKQSDGYPRDVRSTAIAGLPDGTILAAFGRFSGTTIRKSGDGGDTWLSTGLGNGLSSYNIPIMAANDSGTILLIDRNNNSRPLFRSQDGGENWSDTGLGNGLTINRGDIAAAPNGDFYYVNNGGAIFRSTDNGANWSQVSGQLPDNTFASIAVDSTGAVYVFAEFVTGTRVYRSANNGANWAIAAEEGAESGLPDTLNPVAFGAGRNGDLYIISPDNNQGYRSVDNGASWSPVSGLIADFSFAYVTSTPNGSIYAVAGTFSAGGIFASEGSGVMPDPTDVKFFIRAQQ